MHNLCVFCTFSASVINGLLTIKIQTVRNQKPIILQILVDQWVMKSQANLENFKFTFSKVSEGESFKTDPRKAKF